MTKPADLTPEAVTAVLDRIAGKDESALRELHDVYSRRIFLFAMSRLRDEEAAQTVMIDTLYEVWKKPDGFRGESRFSTWLLGIAKYKILSTLRAASQSAHEDIDDYADRIEDPNANIEADMEAAEHGRFLRECIDALNDAQRECVQLVYFDGLALGEIADIQGVPQGTVKTRLFHARKNLTTCVQDKV
ncbi:MAG: sigma-70 family RNA polymerase sigma factor, partial [Burkholderiaceae bacterium]